MTPGHKEVQDIFLNAGEALGYKTQRAFNSYLPSDGIWLHNNNVFSEPLPFIALEVIVSESRKSLIGSVTTLEEISPTIGILLVHDKEIHRVNARKGVDMNIIHRKIDLYLDHLTKLSNRSRQRLVVWTFENLNWLKKLALQI